MKGLSTAANQALLAAAAATARPYQGLASHIANGLLAAKSEAEKGKAVKQSVWAMFKSAIAIAAENQHGPGTMRAGLEIACLEAKVPAGSFRAYVSTVESLYTDLQAGNLTAEEVAEISVADARKRYRTESEDQKARAELAATIKDWSAEEIRLLNEYAKEISARADGDTEEEAEEMPEAVNG